MPRTRIIYEHHVSASQASLDCARSALQISALGVLGEGELLSVERGAYQDFVTDDRFWMSSPKRNRRGRHWAGGPVQIEDNIREKYAKLIGSK